MTTHGGLIMSSVLPVKRRRGILGQDGSDGSLMIMKRKGNEGGMTSREKKREMERNSILFALLRKSVPVT